MSYHVIDTLYKGCLFRSRLEARWAVFFDTLRLGWRYEAEGFATSSVAYLPDFHLADFGVHVEIKPPGHYDLLKPDALAAAGLDCLVLVGDPWPWKYAACVPIADHVVPFPTAQFVHCRLCGSVNLSAFEADGSYRLATLLRDLRPDCGHSFDVMPRSMTGNLRPSRLEEAYYAARTARFDSTGRAADDAGSAFKRAVEIVSLRRHAARFGVKQPGAAP